MKVNRARGFTPLDRKAYLTGLTFIELMIATGIFAVVALAVYSTFGTGISAWRRAQESQDVYQDVRFALDKMAQDLSNAVWYSQKEEFLNFVGEANKISFYSLAEVFHPAPAHQELRKITYNLDESRHILQRWEESFTQLEQEEGGEPGELARAISNLNFSYYYVDGKANPPAYEWKDAWDSAQALPQGVKIELGLKGGKLQFSKYVFIPTGKEGKEGEE